MYIYGRELKLKDIISKKRIKNKKWKQYFIQKKSTNNNNLSDWIYLCREKEQINNDKKNSQQFRKWIKNKWVYCMWAQQ